MRKNETVVIDETHAWSTERMREFHDAFARFDQIVKMQGGELFWTMRTDNMGIGGANRVILMGTTASFDTALRG